jgi:uncharacterized membrane-anchored protein YjiN (DUF445 family)
MHDVNPVAHTAQVHHQLRTFLQTTLADEHPDDLLSALLFEAVSRLAQDAQTHAEVYASLNTWFETALTQIERFGVGHPHP